MCRFGNTEAVSEVAEKDSLFGLESCRNSPHGYVRSYYGIATVQTLLPNIKLGCLLL